MADHRQKAVATVRARNEFYRDGYRTKNQLIVGLVVAVVVLATALAVVSIKKRDRILAQKPDGSIIEAYTLDQPIYSQAWVVNWAAQAVAETLTFGFHDYRLRFQQNRRFFVEPDGWEAFMTAMNKSHFLEVVKDKQMVLSTILQAAPVVTMTRSDPSGFQWTLEMPIVSTFMVGAKKDPLTYLVTLTVVQVPTVERRDGLAILSMVVEPRH